LIIVCCCKRKQIETPIQQQPPISQ
jgi:hypothetical protein